MSRGGDRDQAVIVSLSGMWRLASRPDARVEIVGAGLACCALEVEAAAAQGLLLTEDGNDRVDGPTVLVVAGTVTKALVPAVLRRHAELSRHGEVRVMSFGACSTSGGPYWDAPSVLTGIGSVLEVESYVPGCPPRPQALAAELERIVDSMVAA